MTCFGGGKDMGDELDNYGRQLAICHVWPRVNLNAQMVWDGWALAYRRYSDKFAYAERGAKVVSKGMWAGRFTAPWDWRQRRREREL